jgi:hypothetical protein
MWKVPLTAPIAEPPSTTTNLYSWPNATAPNMAPTPHSANSAYHAQNKSGLVRFLHGAAGFPVPSTWAAAVEAGHYTTWPGLTVALINKHLPKSEATIKGHLQQRSASISKTPITTAAKTANNTHNLVLYLLSTSYCDCGHNNSNKGGVRESVVGKSVWKGGKGYRCRGAEKGGENVANIFGHQGLEAEELGLHVVLVKSAGKAFEGGGRSEELGRDWRPPSKKVVGIGHTRKVIAEGFGERRRVALR